MIFAAASFALFNLAVINDVCDYAVVKIVNTKSDKGSKQYNGRSPLDMSI